MKNKRIIGLGILLVFQLAFPLYFILSKESIHENGKEYLFQVAPVDPYDFFQGKYVSLNIQPLSFQAKPNEFQTNEIVYVTFQTVGNKTSISKVSHNRSTYALKLKVNYSKPNGKLHFALPFKRFYTEESKAKEIETKIAQFRSTDSLQTFVHVKIYNGDFVITDISQEGKSLVKAY